MQNRVDLSDEKGWMPRVWVNGRQTTLAFWMASVEDRLERTTATPSADTPAPECEHGWMLANRLTQYQLDVCHEIGIPPRVKMVCSYCEARMWVELASLDPVS